MDPVSIMKRFAPGDRLCPDSPGIGFMLTKEPLPHRRYKEAMFRIAELHLRRRTHGVGGGLLLTGLSGAGKSTIMKAYKAAFPKQHQPGRTYVPVLMASIPSSPSSRSVAGAILEALGHRIAHRGTAPEKTTDIRILFRECGVEIVLLDEFQHILFPRTLAAFRDLTDWLKNFINDTDVGMVACGLPIAEMVVSSNEQLARRFSEHVRLTPFALEEPSDFQEFRGVLKALEALLPLPCEVPLHESNLARRFHVGSYGLLDYVVKILEGAVSAAVTAGAESIDLPVLAEGLRARVWKDVPEQLNPFHPGSPLRPLDRPGEVFHRNTYSDFAGSPIVRRQGRKFSQGGK